jgi:hypothetical protein
MATDFSALLQDTSETVLRPKALPECWLIGTIGSHAFSNAKNVKQTPYVRFVLQPQGLHPEYADEKLTAAVATAEPPLADREHSVDGWLTPAAKFRVTNFLDRIVGGPNRTMEARIPETQNQRVMYKVKARLGEDGKETAFNDIAIDDVHPYAPTAA